MYRLYQLLMAARQSPTGRHLAQCCEICMLSARCSRTYGPMKRQHQRRWQSVVIDQHSINTACTSKPLACSHIAGLDTHTAEEGHCVPPMLKRQVLHADLAIAPYKEAVGDLWREKWGWSKPIPRTIEARNPHHRTCRLEARFLEGCRNLMRLQCDSDRSWQSLARQS